MAAIRTTSPNHTTERATMLFLALFAAFTAIFIGCHAWSSTRSDD
jgi:hypothetical protein